MHPHWKPLHPLCSWLATGLIKSAWSHVRTQGETTRGIQRDSTVTFNEGPATCAMTARMLRRSGLDVYNDIYWRRWSGRPQVRIFRRVTMRYTDSSHGSPRTNTGQMRNLRKLSETRLVSHYAPGGE
jgi:hypothetical protein